MFYGKWDTKIDEKWRLYIPPAIKKEFGKEVLLKEGEEDGCVFVCKLDFSQVKDHSEIFIGRIKNGGRITIPEFLRNSTSFYFGKNVTVSGKGDHLKIMPRP